jgi:hypothetical protein
MRTEPLHTGRGGPRDLPGGRVANVGLVLGLLLALGPWAAPAGAADLTTINETESYVDPAVAEPFVTVPNLCDEPAGSQGATEGCATLGDRAVRAFQGDSPEGDVYFEPPGAALSTTNAFVPGNVGSTVGNTGYSPLFSMHKYDLFGRAGDRMGPFTREEILFLGQIPTTGGGITNGQTTPGEDTRIAILSVLLTQPEGATSISIGGYTFQYSDLPFYTQLTGFGGGKADTVTDWCLATIGPFICGVLTSEQRGELYAAVHFPEAQTLECGSQQNGQVNETNCKNRDEWVDQVVTGYVMSIPATPANRMYVQNFRSQMGYDPAATVLDSGTQVAADFRMEQSVGLGQDPFEAERQTIQQALATRSTQDFGWIPTDAGGQRIGQLVSQDVQGYFMSCLNCDNGTTAISHAFPPPELDLALLPYEADWQSVPLVALAE